MSLIKKLSHVPMLRHMVAQPRLMVAMILSIALWFFLPQNLRPSTRLLLSWDAGSGLYLILAGLMMLWSNTHKMRARAALQDEGKMMILLLTITTAIASLAGIVAELATAKEHVGNTQWLHVALAGVTVILSWTFMQTMFALHYAHEYYSHKGKSSGGLDFPGEDRHPDYWDFVYFSFIIGTAAQTADVNITSPAIRRLVTLHCLVVFFFNTTILALTVNIGASLF